MFIMFAIGVNGTHSDLSSFAFRLFVLLPHFFFLLDNALEFHIVKLSLKLIYRRLWTDWQRVVDFEKLVSGIVIFLDESDMQETIDVSR